MKRTTKIALALGLAFSFGLGATALNAHPFGSAWGMGGAPGWGVGHMMGYGMGSAPGWGGGHMMGYGPGAGYGMGPGHGMGYGMGPGFGPGAAGNAGAFVENRLAAVKAELKITPAQEGPWNAYLEQAKLQADAMQKWMLTMHESASASLPERIELREQIWKQRQAQSETMTQKVKELYAALTPEQKPLADQLLGGFGPHARGPRGYR